jgi:hypothetical protein
VVWFCGVVLWCGTVVWYCGVVLWCGTVVWYCGVWCGVVFIILYDSYIV